MCFRELGIYVCSKTGVLHYVATPLCAHQGGERASERGFDAAAVHFII
jgi:hypothetical protein